MKKHKKKQWLWLLLIVILVATALFLINIFNKEVKRVVSEAEAPTVLKLNDEENMILEYGDEYTEFGATAKKNNKDITDKIKIINEINLEKLGTYYVTYMINGEVIKRKVTIIDTKAPEIVLKGSLVETTYLGNKYIDTGYTAYDNYDKDITNKVEIIGEVNHNKLGTYTITYKVKDSSGNETVIERTVNVIENPYPHMSLKGNANAYLEVHSNYIEAGYMASDDADGNLTNKVVINGTVDTSKLGVYELTYTVTNSKGKSSTAVRKVIVRDTTKPVITLKGDETIYLEYEEDYIEPGYILTDNYDSADYLNNNIIVTNNIESDLGTYYIKYSLKDSSGNSATEIKRTVVVRDTTKPIITPINTEINLVVIEDYNPKEDVTLSDNYDDGIILKDRLTYTSNIPFKSDVSGTYVVTYYLSDTSDNEAIPVTITYNFIDVIKTGLIGDYQADIAPKLGAELGLSLSSLYWEDKSSSKNHLRLYNMTNDDYMEDYYYFNGGTAYGTTDSNVAINHTTGMSLEFYGQIMSGANSSIMSINGASGNKPGYYLGIDGTGSSPFKVTASSGPDFSQNVRSTNNGVIYSGSFHHIVFVVEPTASPGNTNVSLYIDGVLTELDTINSSQTVDINELLRVMQGIQGKVQTFRIYDKALTTNEVNNNYLYSAIKFS